MPVLMKVPVRMLVPVLVMALVLALVLPPAGHSAVSSVASTSAPLTVDAQPQASADDAEERSTGSVKLTSSDLELVKDGRRDQTIGIRFPGIQVPNGATITAAYIQFQVDEATSDATSLVIEGELSASAQPFSSTDFDISSRARTATSVAWSPPPWPLTGEAGPDQRTPDLTSIVEEITGQPGWTAGNSLVIIISGSGKRVAEAFDGDPVAAPLLHIEVDGGVPVNQPPTVTADAESAVFPSAATLDGTVTDDLLPDPPGMTSVVWSKVSGPGDVSFADAAAADTTATVSEPGLYELQLVADDGELTVGDTVAVSITDANAFPPPPVAQECLNRPSITMLDDTYTTSVSISSPPADHTIDARTAISLTSGGRALEVGSSGMADGACFIGWATFGQQSRTLTWRQMHDVIGGSALRVYGSNYVVDGLRAENVEDAFDPRGGEGFEVRNMWTEYVRDDCIENDERRAGIVSDSLFDGCYTFFSEQDMGSVAGESLIFDRVLVRLQPMPGPHGTTDPSILGHGSFFKKFDDGGRHQPIITDSVFFLEDDCYSGCDDWPPGTTASNVVVVWTGEGPFPMSLLPGMTLTTDRTVWDEAAAEWKQRHGCTTIDQSCTRLHTPLGDLSNTPDAADDAYPVDEDGSLSVGAPGVLGNDQDDDALIARLLTDVDHGVLQLFPDGSFDYTPDPDFFGTDAFTYEADDSNGGTDPALVTLTITGVNDAPVASDDSVTGFTETPTVIGVLDNDSDVDLDLLSVTNLSQPGFGSVVVNADESVTYTPDPGFSGVDTFTYAAFDGVVASDVATVTVTVVAPPDPVAVADSFMVDEDQMLVVAVPGVLGNDTPADGLSASVVTGVSDGALNLVADGSFTYSPAADFYGSDGFVYAATNSLGAVDQATVTITVSAVNDQPGFVAAHPPGVAEDSGAHTVPGWAVFEPGAANENTQSVLAYTVSGVTNPSLFSAQPAVDPTGTLTYTPAADGFGTSDFTVTVQDNGGVAAGGVDTSDPQGFTITVNPVNDAPVAMADTGVTLADTPVVVAVLANDNDIDGDPLELTVATSPDGGEATVNPDGTITYDPEAGFVGDDSFTYQICDPQPSCDTAPVTITVTGNQFTFETRIASGSDDAEERPSGRVRLTSSDLEMVQDKSNTQTIGLRWTGIPVPQGATITNAWVQFQADETDDVSTTLLIAADAADNSNPFANTSGNITGRDTTTATVSWNPPPWSTVGEAGPDQRTPDLAALIQEIVNRPQWAPGNALSLIITGSGQRTAESYDGESDAAPLLHITYLAS